MTSGALTAWLDDPDPSRSVRFAGPGEDWQEWPYDRLALLAWRFAGGLAEAGARSGDLVALVQTSGPRFVASLFGVALAGLTASPVAPRAAFQDPALYDAHLHGALRRSQARFVLADDDLAASVAPVARAAGVATTLEAGEVETAERLARRRQPPDTALVQFTSGSSAAARPVRVSRRALEANVAAIDGLLGGVRNGGTASWLPVHHDMGLVGCLVTPVAHQGDLWLMRPDQFVRSPVRFLRCFAGAAALTAMPTFALGHMCRRVRAADLQGLDLSGWRAVIVGAERVDAAVLDRFTHLVAPSGFRRSAFIPAYGLAEATLAVTAVALADEPTVMSIDPTAVAVGQAVVPVEPGTDVTGVGRPLDGVHVEVVDERGEAAEAGTVGEIVVRGESVADGYIGGADSADSPSLTRFEGGALYTGDAGFLLGGELFVLGRLGDAVKSRGRAVFAEDLEGALRELGIPEPRLAVVLGMLGSEPRAVVMVEGALPVPVDAVLGALSRRVANIDVEVVRVPRRSISKTSSGKPKRRRLWEQYIAGGPGYDLLARDHLGPITRPPALGVAPDESGAA